MEFEGLLEIDKICKKHNIKYYLVGGTLLGAIRHKGFIPWDDDIDIAMLPKDYEKFCEVCKTDLDTERFFWQTQQTDPQYLFTYGRLRRNNTLFLREGQEHIKMHSGVFVDVFIWYNAPNNLLLARIYKFTLARLKTIMWSPIGAKSYHKTLKRLFYRLLSKIPRDFAYKCFLAIVSRVKESDYYAEVGAPLYEKTPHIPSEYVSELCEVEFEGYRFWAPKNWHEYLTLKYGNYMTYPHPEDQVPSHSASKIELVGPFLHG